MKFYMDIVCAVCGGCQCDNEHRFPAQFDISDEGIYKAICPDGHMTNIGLKLYKFDALFEMGAVALIEGYHREAVSNFAASLERFFEFYIDFALFEDGVDPEQFKLQWKYVSQQSERQIGAFLFLYLQRTKNALRPFDDKMVRFRNRVIHKGYIPTCEEAYEYGKAVLSYLDPIMHELETKHEKKLRKHEEQLLKDIPSPWVTTSYMTLVCFGCANQSPRAILFQTKLEKLRQEIESGKHDGITARVHSARLLAPPAPGFSKAVARVP